MYIARISSLNQWPSQNFRNQIESDTRSEVRAVAALGDPICLDTIRAAVVTEILMNCLPAGNA